MEWARRLLLRARIAIISNSPPPSGAEVPERNPSSVPLLRIRRVNLQLHPDSCPKVGFGVFDASSERSIEASKSAGGPPSVSGVFATTTDAVLDAISKGGARSCFCQSSTIFVP